jgi:putative NADPH-quinone reductase
MSQRRLVIIDGHPDSSPDRFVHALADSYARGAAVAGHEARRSKVAELEFPLIGSRRDWEADDIPADICRAQEAILWAEHLLILYPLWLGDMPALLKGFLEQVMRPGFAFGSRAVKSPEKKLKGRSAQLVVTMGMPALFYRTFYGAHSVKSFERNILKFAGIGPVEHLLVGNVEGGAAARRSWLDALFERGKAGC